MRINPTKKIQLKKGQFSTIDKDIFDLINNYKWQAHKSGNTYYAGRSFRIGKNKRKSIKIHHIVIGHPLHGLQVDHIDGNGLNNVRSNLRIVTKRQNACNRWFHRKGLKTSNYIGVSWFRSGKKWRATIGINGKHKSIGYFYSEIDASKAYQEALLSLSRLPSCSV